MPLKARIATFNLENFGSEGRETAASSQRLPRLREQMVRLAADILCLQEVNAERGSGGRPRDFSALDALLRDTSYATFNRTASVRPGATEPADIHNLVILSRWTISASRQVFHEFVPPLTWSPPVIAMDKPNPVVVQWERPLLHARVELPLGCSLDIVNVHLRAPRAAFIAGAKSGRKWATSAAWAEGLFLAALKRDGQALELRLLVEELFDGRADPGLAICGDFNAEPHDIAMRIVQIGRDDVQEVVPPGRDLVAVETRAPLRNQYSVIHDGRLLLPDHILVSRSLEACCSMVAIDNAGLVDEVYPGQPIVGSLHAPILADFVFPND
jgi:endonuclease/exonuclease/phosphatase family metal-dependent hydrolase